MNEKENKYSILIVDDDKFLLDMYAIKFGEKDFNVETVLSGTEAISKLESDGDKIDVMLLDIVMPGLDGFAVLEEIKKKKLAEKTTVIVLSNLGQKEDIDRGISLGANGYIVKASSTPSEVVEKTLQIIKEK